MENSGEKSVKDDGFEFGSLESRTKRNSSNSVTGFSPLGWPVRKAQVISKCSDASGEKLKAKSQFDGESKTKKFGAKVSGMFYFLVFWKMCD